jgi:hypothetical protein
MKPPLSAIYDTVITIMFTAVSHRFIQNFFYGMTTVKYMYLRSLVARISDTGVCETGTNHNVQYRGYDQVDRGLGKRQSSLYPMPWFIFNTVWKTAVNCGFLVGTAV